MKIKIFFAKLVVLILAAAAIQVGYSYLRKPYQKMLNQSPIKPLYQFLEKKVDVIYLGDSIINYADKEEENQDSIENFLSELNPELEIANLSHPSFNLGLYVDILKAISKSNHQPKAIITPINLRSFSPSWYRRPEYQFAREKYILRHNDKAWFRVFFRSLMIMKWFPFITVTDSEFMRSPVYKGDRIVGYVKDFEGPPKGPTFEDDRRTYFIYNYMGLIRPDHERIEELRRVIEEFKSLDSKPLFYFNPIDYQTGESLLGEEFIEVIKANLETLQIELSKEGMPYWDFTFDFPKEYFTYDRAPNGHVFEVGRRKTAEKVSKVLRSLLILQ